MKIVYFLMSNSTLFKSPAIYTFVWISLLVVLAVSAINQTNKPSIAEQETIPKVSRKKVTEQNNNREQKETVEQN